MNQEDKILDNPHLKANPFSLPDGYFESVVSQWTVSKEPVSVTEVPKERTQWGKIWYFVKPSFALAAGFALLFGLGYGTMQLTRTQRVIEGDTLMDEFSALYQYVDASTVRYFLENGTADLESDPISMDEMIEYLSAQGVNAESLEIDNE